MRTEEQKNLLWTAALVSVLALAAGVGFWAWQAGPAQPASTAFQGDLGVIQDFSLTDQQGKPFGLADLKGKVWVASFTYASCKTSCPMVGAQMARLQELIPPSPDFKLVTITVDPEKDDPAGLAQWAAKLGAAPGRWQFLTGPRKAVTDLAYANFKVPAEPGVRKPLEKGGYEITHSNDLILVDSRGHVRGYFDGLVKSEVDVLRHGIWKLLPVPVLPRVNAALNGLSALLLATGYFFIRRQDRRTHRGIMLAACATSAVFLACYLTYHWQAGSVRFTGLGWTRPVYFSILISHTILAASVPVLAGIILFRALKGDFERHRNLARWVLPIWLYVSVTGVAVYWMLYQW